MTFEEQVAYTQEVFKNLIGEKIDRLTRGVLLRTAMHEAIARGESPTGYRPEWLAAVSGELVNYLVAKAEDFNKQHLDDMVSVSDILDILATTAAMFRAKVKD